MQAALFMLKDQSKIEATVDDTITFFKEHIQSNYQRYVKDSTDSIDLKCGDSKKYLNALDAGSVDLICTSPPYGDNHTTVTYGQFSILPLLWIDKKDLYVWDETILETFTAIDSASLGGRVKRKPATACSYSEFVDSISLEKRKKVIAFLDDYETIFSLLARVLKPGKLLVLTLGNRRVDNKEIAFDVFNDMLARKYGMELDSTITRNITGKRMPAKVSSIKEVGAVKSMSATEIQIKSAPALGTYEPSGNYSPKKLTQKSLFFTKAEGQIIGTLIGQDDLSNKIHDLTFELSKLDLQIHRHAIAYLYRALLESATKYLSRRQIKVQFNEKALESSVVSALNYFGDQCNTNKQLQNKTIRTWRDTITQRKLIDTLNQYIHNEQPVDAMLLQETWNTMKGYIIACLTVT